MIDITTKSINIYDLLICITKAGDLVNKELENHHQQVAYLAYQIAEQLGFSADEKKDLITAGLLHDIGALSFNERLELLEDEAPSAHNHAFRGAKLIESFTPLKNAADIIRYHHINWNNGEGSTYNGKNVSKFSHILHLADRIAVLIDKRKNILRQVKSIKSAIEAKRGTLFVPEFVDAFIQISYQEFIWLDLVNSPMSSLLPETAFDVVDLPLDEVINLTKIFSKIIDFRSHFTANHSIGVALTAEKLAELAGFSENECKMMLVAGYLHDIGKLAVKKEILEKPGKLDEDEFDEIKSHTFHTFRLLQSIRGFETINRWAAFHHEKLNGTGYPFHLCSNNLPLGSRIMSVADIFTALIEDRPYRKGMADEQVKTILKSMVEDNTICPYVVSLLLNNYELIHNICVAKQQQAEADYNEFLTLE